MSRTHRRDKDWDRMASIPAKIGPTLVEQLMAGPNQSNEKPFPEDVRIAVAKAIELLDDKDKFIIEAVYLWGKSYSQIAKMMGYSSKGTPHYALKRAHRNLGAILETDDTIKSLLGGKHMSNPENWETAAWKQLRYLDKNSNVGDFMPSMFALEFTLLGQAVTENNTTRMYDLCWNIANEAARGLVAIGKWDAEYIADILASKQHDYGHDNINAFGIVGVAVRISDKIARYKNLVANKADAINESLVDTLVDMVGYGVISRMLEDGTFDLPLEWKPSK